MSARVRAIAAVALAWVFSACAQPAHEPYNPLIDESVRLSEKGRYAEAVKLAERALEGAEAAMGPEHPDVATALNNLAEFQLMQAASAPGRDEAALQAAAAMAEPLHKRALAIREKALGARHSFTLASAVNLARDYQFQRRYDEAEALYTRTLGIINEIGPRAPILVDLARQATSGLRQIATKR